MSAWGLEAKRPLEGSNTSIIRVKIEGSSLERVLRWHAWGYMRWHKNILRISHEKGRTLSYKFNEKLEY